MDASLCEASHVERLTFRITFLGAVICLVSVVVAVVATGRDGAVADWLGLLALGSLVVAWRLDRRSRSAAVSD
jgi:uncharacterized membrane protein YqjE